MGYGMKYTKGGFPFKAETGTDRVSPNSPASPNLYGDEETNLPNLSGTKGDGVKANMFQNQAKQTSGPRAKKKALNEDEEKVITSMPSPHGDGGRKTDFFIRNLHTDTEISLDKKKNSN